MKLLSISLIVFGLLFCKSKSLPVLHADKNRFAVIELFTSEGCSSCPPAEALAEKINTEYADRNVLVLAYHVDYWDHLGWKDSFSSAANTKRQNYYAALFHLQSIYTPEAIVNGEKEFVGSDRKKTEDALKILKENRNMDVFAEQKGNKIHVLVKEVDLKPEEQILVAAVQREASIQVGKGENRGRQLHHINIVQAFKILSSERGDVEFNYASQKENYFIATIIENKNTGEILGSKVATIE